ncbi:hypothetical protein [Sphingobium baderi]|nr:hypothetical protein [Sphingobium baderi]WRD75285.1 hypothetical protein QQ987_10790 [Sphingobium baderi]
MWFSQRCNGQFRSYSEPLFDWIGKRSHGLRSVELDLQRLGRRF